MGLYYTESKPSNIANMASSTRNRGCEPKVVDTCYLCGHASACTLVKAKPMEVYRLKKETQTVQVGPLGCTHLQGLQRQDSYGHAYKHE